MFFPPCIAVFESGLLTACPYFASVIMKPTTRPKEHIGGKEILVVRGCDLDENQPWLCFSSSVHARMCVCSLYGDVHVH